MPKASNAKQVGSSTYGDAKVAVDLFELTAKTGKDDKKTEFTYTFPKFGEAVTLSQLESALTYKNSKGETVSGLSVLRSYVNDGIKNEARSKKLAEINGVLALREDPEKAIADMVNNMVIGFGVPREIAEANVRAMIASGAVKTDAA